MRKLILKCGLAPGDILILTAAVRDLHLSYPGQFVTDVRTTCSELWAHNPYLTRIPDNDPEAEQIDCDRPLIHRSNTTPLHYIHWFLQFLNDRLGLAIRPTAFKGDIHLSATEKSRPSQVSRFTREDLPYWIVAAGGKYDITIKWWETERYQKVVDHFRGRIQFVQIGRYYHHHPKLDGVVDLRGQTNLRELIHLVYHSQGVLCPVTAVMHLAAAVETRKGRLRNRPCVVIAGGREPAHFEAYPHHQFIHTNGALACCADGGCWKARTVPLHDGDRNDNPEMLCVNVAGNLPRCMDMITPEEVIRRIELYFSNGIVKYLPVRHRLAGRRGVEATAPNPYDEQPLTIRSAGMACDEFVTTIPVYPGGYHGRGIVICAGGQQYFTSAWIGIHMLRHLGCRLPIELWHFGRRELSSYMKSLVTPLGVECIDAAKVRRQFPARILGGWTLKPFSILHSSFRQVLFLDADNVPVVNPDFLFDTPQFKSTGAIFWPDQGNESRADPIWRSCNLQRPAELEFESGQMLFDKQRCWRALSLAGWFNEHADFYYQHLHGDKETFHLAFQKLRKKYLLVPAPIQNLEGTFCQHDFQGRRIFQHRSRAKWRLFESNVRIEGFWFEDECRKYLAALRRVWDGEASVNRGRAAGPRLRILAHPGGDSEELRAAG